MAAVGTSWYLKVSNVIAGQTLIDGTPAYGAVLTYVGTNKNTGATYVTGTMTWNGFGFTNVWVDEITLPSTPCRLVFVVTASATLPTGNVIGKAQTSIEVT